MGVLDPRPKAGMVPGRRFFRWRVLVPAAAIMFLVLLLPGASLYYNYSGGRSCARCHEIWQPYRDWHESAHRDIACAECHGDVFTLDAGFHLRNIGQLLAHLRGRVPEQVRIKSDEVFRIGERCAKCHRAEHAAWAAGPHGATYTRIFLDKDHNRQRRLMDDCLRCHGMYFEGSIRELVTPVDTQGPWSLLNPRLSEQPAIPCIACHQMHRHGSPLPRFEEEAENPGPRQELSRPSLAMFDRRGMDYVALDRLPMPRMYAGEELVKISPDRRQALCYQCHAPVAGGQVGSGDDRTPLGVHEGLSCLACHDQHGQTTRASCANCHPQLSNCGIDVETMDTSFKSRSSKHNVHTVTCAECHTKGVPKKRVRRDETAGAKQVAAR